MNDAKRRTVLVVDDEADVRQFLKAALVEAGFEVMTAADGFEALEQVKKQIPDLVSLDLVMPRKSGAKFYHELTHERKWAKIPVIIVTGHAQDDLGKADLRELTMSGPGVYLEKPVRPDNYVAAVKKILGMEEVAGTKEGAGLTNLQKEVHQLIEGADERLLEKLRNFLKGNSKS